MELIIDVQAFRDNDNNFIAKEVAVVAVNAPYVGHWILQPQYPFGALKEKARRQNYWLTKNYHGIEWYNGETDQEYLFQHLREITRNVWRIYAKGSEKTAYLRNLLGRDIYNLEEVFPSLNYFPPSAHVWSCTYHGYRVAAWNSHFHCALVNAYKLKEWLIAQGQNEDSDEEGEKWRLRKRVRSCPIIAWNFAIISVSPKQLISRRRKLQREPKKKKKRKQQETERAAK